MIDILTLPKLKKKQSYVTFFFRLFSFCYAFQTAVKSRSIIAQKKDVLQKNKNKIFLSANLLEKKSYAVHWKQKTSLFSLSFFGAINVFHVFFTFLPEKLYDCFFCCQHRENFWTQENDFFWPPKKYMNEELTLLQKNTVYNKALFTKKEKKKTSQGQ